MAWRRYPKYEKKIKTYKDYTHLTYQEINNKKNYFIKSKEEITVTLEEVSRFEENINKFKNKISSDPKIIFMEKQIKNRHDEWEACSLSISKVTKDPKYENSYFGSMFGSPYNKEGDAKIDRLNEKQVLIWKEETKISNSLHDIYKQKSKKIPYKKFKIYKKEFEFVPESINLYVSENIRLTNLRDYAEKNIIYIDKYLEPINKAHEMIKKRYNLNEEKINKVKEEASKYKAQAYAHQQKTRDLSEEIKKEIKNQENIFPVCPYCEQSLGLEPHADHIYPVTLGGLGTKENMVYVCSKCNQSKGPHTLREFIKKKDLNRDRVENNLSLLGKKF